MTSGEEEDGGGSSRATTRKTTKKRKTRTHVAFYERRDSLWDVIVKWDDICFKHILPRLNRTDVKILYEVNTETRKLIKRSSRAWELKEKLKVEEMSSISTLEVAWENRRGLWKDETLFCVRVACTNKLELLKWAREEKKCKWDKYTIIAAAQIVPLSHLHSFSSLAHLSNSSLFVQATFSQKYGSSILTTP